ncbi:ribonucleotide-diphosphate reductase subunit alpha, partial [Pantoea agglomerans]|nr:ribonucleotide-diphosphate reductase subunit alpha [Pantoea agglomerans]
AQERQQTFDGFADSQYASGVYFDKYLQREWLPRTERVATLLRTSNQLAQERQQTFDGFADSQYASGVYFDKYLQREWLPR